MSKWLAFSNDWILRDLRPHWRCTPCYLDWLAIICTALIKQMEISFINKILIELSGNGDAENMWQPSEVWCLSVQVAGTASMQKLDPAPKVAAQILCLNSAFPLQYMLECSTAKLPRVFQVKYFLSTWCNTNWYPSKGQFSHWGEGAAWDWSALHFPSLVWEGKVRDWDTKFRPSWMLSSVIAVVRMNLGSLRSQ